MRTYIVALFLLSFSISFAQVAEVKKVADSLKLNNGDARKSSDLDLLELTVLYGLNEGFEKAEKAAKKSDESAKKAEAAFRSILGEDTSVTKYEGYMAGLVLDDLKWTFEFIDDKKLIISSKEKVITLDIQREYDVVSNTSKKYKVLTKQTGYFKWHGILLMDFSKFSNKYKSESAGLENDKDFNLLITGTNQLNFVLDKI